MHIQVSGQQNQIGESLQSAVESRLVAMATERRRGAVLAPVIAPGPARGERWEETTRTARTLFDAARGFAKAATPARAHGGLDVVYRRPDGTIGWIDAGPERPARG